MLDKKNPINKENLKKSKGESNREKIANEAIVSVISGFIGYIMLAIMKYILRELKFLNSFVSILDSNKTLKFIVLFFLTVFLSVISIFIFCLSPFLLEILMLT